MNRCDTNTLLPLFPPFFSPPFFPHDPHYLWFCHYQKFKFKKKKIITVIQWIIDINHPQHKTLIVKHPFTGKESNSLQVFHRSKSSSTFSTTTTKQNKTKQNKKKKKNPKKSKKIETPQNSKIKKMPRNIV